MAEANSRRRKLAVAPARKPIKVSVPVDPDTYVRLCAAAAMSGRTHGALVADLLRDHLRGLVIFDKRAKSDDSAAPDDDVDRRNAG